MMERRKFVKIMAISAGGVTLPIRHFEAMGGNRTRTQARRHDYQQ